MLLRIQARWIIKGFPVLEEENISGHNRKERMPKQGLATCAITPLYHVSNTMWIGELCPYCLMNDDLMEDECGVLDLYVTNLVASDIG